MDVGEWQAKQGVPQSSTVELTNVSFEVPIPSSVEELQDEYSPNLPWAEDHFRERVSGTPLNPPPSHEWWPFAQDANAEHKGEVFSHTYPERFWPKWAHAEGHASWEGDQEIDAPHSGIRYQYGSLADLVVMLAARPNTRQAYLPVWFPEDLHAASVVGERVPCTLGYHFLHRAGELQITYYLRSCDFYRHFRDDAYMAARLCQWVAEQASERGTRTVMRPSNLVMHITSLHVFESDLYQLKREHTMAKEERIWKAFA